jgi:hypothetical protein
MFYGGRKIEGRVLLLTFDVALDFNQKSLSLKIPQFDE